MSVHVGQLISIRLQKVGMTKAEFGRRINKTSQNIHAKIKRKSIDTQLLVKISEVLSYDFFKHFSSSLNDEKNIHPDEALLISEDPNVCYCKKKSPDADSIAKLIAAKELEIKNECLMRELRLQDQIIELLKKK